MPKRSPLHLAALAAAITVSACSVDDRSQPFAHLTDIQGGPVFLARSEPATAVMEAFFDGRVVLDGAGCFRLELAHPDGATVVWPHGAVLEPAGDSYRVRGGDGRVIGVIGERFRFGGGFIGALYDRIALTDEARAGAVARCPGSYWIVGDVP